MTAKDLIFNFLNLIFIVALVVFCIFYSIASNHFEVFSSLMTLMAPLAVFGIIFLVKLKITRSEIKKRKKEDNTIIVLHLNIFHKLVSDIIVFCTPMFLGVLIYKARGSLISIDMIILAMVFLIMFFWQRYLFNNER